MLSLLLVFKREPQIRESATLLMVILIGDNIFVKSALATRLTNTTSTFVIHKQYTITKPHVVYLAFIVAYVAVFESGQTRFFITI